MGDDKDNGSGGNEALKAFARFSQAGITMAAAVFVGVFAGKFLDKLFGTSPFLLLIFSFLGVGAAIRLLFSMFDKK